MVRNSRRAKSRRDAAKLKARVEVLRAESGRENQIFREDLITYLLDYNTLATQNMALLVGVMAANGYEPVETTDAGALQLAFRYLCEEAAVCVTNLPEHPVHMLAQVDNHLNGLVHAQAAPELREARRLMHVLLGGTAISR